MSHAILVLDLNYVGARNLIIIITVVSIQVSRFSGRCDPYFAFGFEGRSNINPLCPSEAHRAKEGFLVSEK